MKTNVVVHSTALTNGNVNRSLREGSSVYVRVLKNNGNNSYTVAFGGGRFNITSNLQLEAGAAFLTKIKLEGSKIILQQQNLKLQVQAQKIQKMTAHFDEMGRITNQQMISYFERMGLIPDQISYTLYNLMKELGAKYSRQNFIKARAIGTKFKDNEKNAAAIAYLIEQKGIAATYQIVEQILNDENQMFLTESNFEESENNTENPFKQFFTGIFNGENIDNKKTGPVTLFNHLGFKYKDGKILNNWIKIPFDFKYNSNEEKYGNGFFSALINNQTHKTEKVLLRFNFPAKDFTFVMDFDDGQPNRIRFAGNETEAVMMEIADCINRKLEKISVEIMNRDEISDFYADEDEILSYNGVI